MTASFQREVGIQICIIKNIKIYKELLSDVLLHSFYTAYISLWIPKRQAISTDTSFKIEMTVKIYAIEIIFKLHAPFQNYLLTDQA